MGADAREEVTRVEPRRLLAVAVQGLPTGLRTGTTASLTLLGNVP